MSEKTDALIQKVGLVYKDGSSGAPGTFYSPIPFPEYSKQPCHKINCILELETIKRHYDFKGKKVLEIGSAGGYFTFNLAKLALGVVAFEADTEVYEVTESIREEKDIRNIRFINERFNGYTGEPDVCLMLNVHMWLHKQYGATATKQLLKDLNCTLFFQTAHKESHAMYKVYELETKEDIADYLADCGFDPKLIGTNEHDGAPRYLFKATK